MAAIQRAPTKRQLALQAAAAGEDLDSAEEYSDSEDEAPPPPPAPKRQRVTDWRVAAIAFVSENE